MNRITILFKTFVECYEVGCTNHPKMSIYLVPLQIDIYDYHFFEKKDDIKTNESTIKTAAPRGALRLFYNYV